LEGEMIMEGQISLEFIYGVVRRCGRFMRFFGINELFFRDRKFREF
jgi:hypothetical protein